MNTNDISITSVGVTVLPGKQGQPYKNPNDVEFDVKYPKDYKGVKHMPEGIVVTSKESAEIFTAQGIGSIVKKKDEVKEEVKEEKKEEKVDAPVVNYEKLNKGQLEDLVAERLLEVPEKYVRQDLIDLLIGDDNSKKS